MPCSLPLTFIYYFLILSTMMPSKSYLLMLAMAITLCQPAAWAEENTPSPPPYQQEEIMKSPTNLLKPDIEEIKGPPSNTPVQPEKQNESPGIIDLVHGELSRNLLSTADWLDSFFGDRSSMFEDNSSYVRVFFDAFQEDRAKLLLRPAVDLRLVLPQLEKKTYLVFSAEPTETPRDAGTPVIPVGQRAVTTEERNFTTAIEYFVRSVSRESFIIRTGAQIRNERPVFFATPRYRTLVPIQLWDFRFTQEATYWTDTGWQTDTRFDFERKLPHDLFFRTTIDGAWYANSDGYFPSLIFSLRQTFDASHALDYEWVNNYQTSPIYELTEAAFRLRYRHSFLRQWLFFEVAPQIRFPQDMNFEGTPGILFRFEMFFGK